MREFQIMIVDDEEIAIRGIEEGINWDKLNITRIFKTHTIETAKRILSTNEIDVLLTDIELGGSTGIELLAWVREEMPEMPCVFFTAHAEFRYAQEAVRLGVKEYILKPIEYANLEKIIERILNQIIENENMQDRMSYLEPLNLRDETDESDEAIKIAKDYINHNMAEEITLEGLASLVNYSPTYFGRLFNKVEGKSVKKYLMDVRIARAKYLLKYTKLSVTVIAADTGFNYLSYFTRCFKTEVGMSPNEYRNLNV